MSDLSHIHEQVEMIARHEQEFLERRTRSERLGDVLGASVGSIWFISFHALGILLWIAFNSVRTFQHFDPAPFPMLDTIVAIEAIFLASFIVMRQGRLSRRSDERNHLILQLLILTEREITAVLGIQRQVAEKLRLQVVRQDEAIDQLTQETPIEAITQKLHEHLSDV